MSSALRSGPFAQAHCSGPPEAGRIGRLLEKLFDAEATGSRFGDLQDPLASRADQLSRNVGHLPAQTRSVEGEGNSDLGGLFPLRRP